MGVGETILFYPYLVTHVEKRFKMNSIIEMLGEKTIYKMVKVNIFLVSLVETLRNLILKWMQDIDKKNLQKDVQNVIHYSWTPQPDQRYKRCQNKEVVNL